MASRLGSETESVRDEAAEGLVTFSDALKAATAEFSGKRLGFAGDAVQQAATGLKTLAQSFEGRSPGEMLEAVHCFGRQNPVGSSPARSTQALRSGGSPLLPSYCRKAALQGVRAPELNRACAGYGRI